MAGAVIDTTEAQSSYLLTLPVELLDRICHYIEDANTFGHLRRASKELKGRTDKAFASRYFSNLQVKLHYDGLNDLLNVATHPLFSKAVTSLEIVPDYFSEEFDYIYWEEGKYNRRGPGPEYLCPPDQPCGQMASKARLNGAKIQHRIRLQQQTHIIQSGADVEILTLALKDLHSLKTIYVGTVKRQSQYGSARTDSTTGQSPECTDTSVQSPYHNSIYNRSISHCLGVLLQSLAKTTQTVLNLHMGAAGYMYSDDNGGEGEIIHPEAIALDCLRLSAIVRQGLRKSFKELRSLSLIMDAWCSPVDKKGHASLATFLSLAPTIEHLKLSMPRDHYSPGDISDEWLSYAVLRAKFPYLHTLEVDDCRCTPESFITFLKRHLGTLRSLSICAVPWPEINTWRTFIEDLIGEYNAQLDEVSLRWLLAEYKGRVNFGSNIPPDCESCKFYPSGPDFVADGWCKHLYFHRKGNAEVRQGLKELISTMALREWERR